MVEQKQHKILTEPLPQILDELEAAITSAKAATQEAHSAAAAAKLAGEKAAEVATKAALKGIETLGAVMQEKLEKLSKRIQEIEVFVGKMNDAQVASLNASVKAYNDVMGTGN